ncbi:MAG: hypothetical protein ACLT8E_03830 [Akkermansia sp.]
MFAFVDFFWDRGGGLTHLLFLILADAAMTFVCLGISSWPGVRTRPPS